MSSTESRVVEAVEVVEQAAQAVEAFPLLGQKETVQAALEHLSNIEKAVFFSERRQDASELTLPDLSRHSSHHSQARKEPLFFPCAPLFLFSSFLSLFSFFALFSLFCLVILLLFSFVFSSLLFPLISLFSVFLLLFSFSPYFWCCPLFFLFVAPRFFPLFCSPCFSSLFSSYFFVLCFPIAFLLPPPSPSPLLPLLSFLLPLPPSPLPPPHPLPPPPPPLPSSPQEACSQKERTAARGERWAWQVSTCWQLAGRSCCQAVAFCCWQICCP